MKKNLTLIVICFMIVLFVIYFPKQEKAPGFEINNMTYSLGSVDGNSSDETRYSYTLTISAPENDLRSITDVRPVLGGNIKNRLVREETTQMHLYDSYMEVSGTMVFDTQGLSKEQIMELGPYIENVKIITEHTVELTQHVDSASQ